MVHGELWGITAEGWVALATFAGAGAVVLGGLAVIVVAWYGAKRFLEEQEAHDVRKYLVEEGAWKLKASLDRLLQIVTLNQGAALHLLRLMRDLPRGESGAPRTEDLPRLFPMGPEDFAFDAIRPASRVLNCMELGPLASTAFARIYNVHAIFTAEVEQTIRTYYAGNTELSEEQRLELVTLLKNRVERETKRANEFRKLAGWLEDSGLRVQELKISKLDEMDRLHEDRTIKSLATKVKEMDQSIEREAEDS